MRGKGAIQLAKRIFVGGLSYSTTSEGLREIFETVGPVVSSEVITDRETGRSRGFGFVEMENDALAEQAISKLNGTVLDGRTLTVNEARERTVRPGGFSGYGGDSGGRDRGGRRGGGGGRRDRDRW